MAPVCRSGVYSGFGGGCMQGGTAEVGVANEIPYTPLFM